MRVPNWPMISEPFWREGRCHVHRRPCRPMISVPFTALVEHSGGPYGTLWTECDDLGALPMTSVRTGDDLGAPLPMISERIPIIESPYKNPIRESPFHFC